MIKFNNNGCLNFFKCVYLFHKKMTRIYVVINACLTNKIVKTNAKAIYGKINRFAN